MKTASLIKPAPTSALALLAASAFISTVDALSAPSMHYRGGNLITLLLLASQGVIAQTTSDCTWVVKSWIAMGKTTTVSSTSATACCSMAGVICDSDRKTVLRLLWDNQGLCGSIPPQIGNLGSLIALRLHNNNELTGSIPKEIGNLRSLTHVFLHECSLSGSIPSEIGNLTNLKYLGLSRNELSGSIPVSIGNLKALTHLYLDLNKFTGSIPASIGNLTNLIELFVNNNRLSGTIPPEIGQLKHLTTVVLTGMAEYNPNFTGTFTPRYGMTVYASRTNITICGRAAASTPAISFPTGTLACLAAGPASPLVKRAEVFTISIQTYKFSCSVDNNYNPFQDCLNTMSALCNPTFITKNSTRISNCKTSVDGMFSQMNPLWQAVPASCALWKSSSTSTACNTANKKLTENAYYTSPTGRVPVTSALTDSIKQNLWGNPELAPTK